MTFKKMNNLAGWLVFAIAFVVYYLSAEPTGSLWDCGEFITGAYKLEVVHPPGAALFMMIGRMFVLVAQLFSDNPENIAFAVNIMSGMCTAAAAMFTAWVTGMFAKLALVGREGEATSAQALVCAGAGFLAGLATAFCTSIWFSAVEGEVYALSLFFNALVIWGMVKWYFLPDTPQADRWIVFSLYMGGLSIGVHLLSLLTFPGLAMLYYLKKYKEHSLLGMAISGAVGVLSLLFIQITVILGIPRVWSWFELFTVNTLGLPTHSGLILLIPSIFGAIYFALRYAHKHQFANFQKAVVAISLIVIGFSTIGVIVIRANADTPINMNANKNVMRLIPYLNREQYGERPLLYGPHFAAEVKGVDIKEDRYDYDKATKKYKVVDQKMDYVYDNADKMLFPRVSHSEGSRPALYTQKWGMKVPPSFVDNISFFISYQIKWMYWRYFMWNFSGRQNAEQGFYTDDAKSGNWITGITPLDNLLVGGQSDLPDTIANNKGRNAYYMLPFIFGLIGLFYQIRKRNYEALAVGVLFFMTGLAIIVYSNQPPNEPRERDYVLVGSFLVFCIWIGLGAVSIYEWLEGKLKGAAAPVSLGLVAIAPLLMLTQNFDDSSRAGHYGARDYASNFLNSVDKNAIIFTYGDNDTYPLWYAQEVENIRTDVRVVNLSLIQVDWYINQLRRKVNNSAALKMMLPASSYEGRKMTQVAYLDDKQPDQPAAFESIVNFIAQQGEEAYLPTNIFNISVNREKIFAQGGMQIPVDSMLNTIQIALPLKGGRQKYTLKGDLALVDIVASNINDRPIYFATTIPSPDESLLGFKNYTQMEGLALRIVPAIYPADSRFQGLQTMSLGTVHNDKIFENITKKWRWGNFDKEATFVDEKYGPSIQCMRVSFMRGIRSLLDKKDNARATQLVDKYFEAFPHRNFPYDFSTFEFLRMYAQAGSFEKAKPHIDILAKETYDHLKYYNSLDENILMSSGYADDYGMAMRTKDNLIALAAQQNDTALKEKLEKQFEAFKSK